MNFVHFDLNLGSDDIAVVSLDKQANVRLMDSSNFSKYKRGLGYKAYGGLAKESPINLQPPYSGHWHIAVDLGGHSGAVRASVNTVKC